MPLLDCLKSIDTKKDGDGDDVRQEGKKHYDWMNLNTIRSHSVDQYERWNYD